MENAVSDGYQIQTTRKKTYRVAEINSIYDWLPADFLEPDSDGNLVPGFSPGPGWIYVSNEIELPFDAFIIAVGHTARTGLKTRIDVLDTVNNHG